jgi:7-cyano-7-deazaguanine reductase
MNNYDTVSAIAAEHLGKNSGDYSNFVNISEVRPDLLVSIPRSLNRVDYGIDNETFFGFDTWHGFEVSTLTDNGLPISGMVKVIYPSDSPNIVESKSMKLYWNSFNMAKIGGNKRENVIAALEIKAEYDLSKLLGCDVYVNFFVDGKNKSGTMGSFALLDDYIDYDVEFDSKPTTTDLLVSDGNMSSIRVFTPNLRSNCRVTHQPDFGDLYIHMKGDEVPSFNSLMVYIVSFRKENHFHEECVEMIYKALQDKFKPDELMVTALYTRRGGWNICPARASHKHILPESLISINFSHTNGNCLFRQ